MARQNPIKRIFDLYTSDLSMQEIERLIKRDAAEVYDFFASDIPKPDTTKNKLVRALIFVRSLFNAFILKLTPGRRIVYLISLIIFFLGFVQGIGSYVIVAFVLLNGLLAFELADKLTVKDDLELARQIQSKLMPDKVRNEGIFNIATMYEAAREVGGDYFDIIPADKGKYKSYLIIGDISGKGLSAALYMMRVQAFIHCLVNTYESPKDIVINLNNYFSKNLRSGHFLTLAGAGIEEDGNMTIFRAGHTPALHYVNSKDEFQEINPKGMGLGLNNKGIFESTIEEVNLKPDQGDILLFYTDGLTETMNEQKKQYGMNRLKRIISENREESATYIKEKIHNSLTAFRGNSPYFDDITLVILKVK